MVVSASFRFMRSAQFIAGLVLFTLGTAAPGMSRVTPGSVTAVAGAKAIGIANIATNTITKKATLLVIALAPFKLDFVHFVMKTLAPSLRNGQSRVKVGLSDETTNCLFRCAVL